MVSLPCGGAASSSSRTCSTPSCRLCDTLDGAKLFTSSPRSFSWMDIATVMAVMSAAPGSAASCKDAWRLLPLPAAMLLATRAHSRKTKARSQDPKGTPRSSSFENAPCNTSTCFFKSSWSHPCVKPNNSSPLRFCSAMAFCVFGIPHGSKGPAPWLYRTCTHGHLSTSSSPSKPRTRAKAASRMVGSTFAICT